MIKGSAVNNDGSEKAGYTAPSVNSQADVVVEALANAGVDADSISYIEAHGSGTPVGDPIEIRALTKAFRTSTQRSGLLRHRVGKDQHRASRRRGGSRRHHQDRARAQAPPASAEPPLQRGQSRNRLSRPRRSTSTPDCVEWTSDGPRRAGVMSTGMGGTNAHVVLEEAPELRRSTSASGPHLLVLSAKTETALDQATHRLREFLERDDSVNMGDVAYTLQIGRKAFPHRRCSGLCRPAGCHRRALGHGRLKAGPFQPDGRIARRPVIFLLPGIGDHYVGMAHDLYETWADVQTRSRSMRADSRAAPGGRYPGASFIRRVKAGRRRARRKGIDFKKMLGRHTDARRSRHRGLSIRPCLPSRRCSRSNMRWPVSGSRGASPLTPLSVTAWVSTWRRVWLGCCRWRMRCG